MNKKEYNKRLKAYKKLSREDLGDALMNLEEDLRILDRTADGLFSSIVPGISCYDLSSRGFSEYAYGVREKFNKGVASQIRAALYEIRQSAPPDLRDVTEEDEDE